MKKFVIEPTHSTPEMILDPDERRLQIKGICTPENPRMFFAPLFMAIDEYLKHSQQLTIDIYLNYYNSGSGKCLLHLFLKTSIDAEIKKNTVVNWIIDKDDDELKESGMMFEEITGLKFNYPPL